MWFVKQGSAFAYHDSRADHIVVAEDISAQGHKRYGVFPRTQIDTFTGPYCELIRVHSKCRLYFDLDGGPDTKPSVVDEVVALVQARLLALYGVEATPLVLCSSNVSKFSKHIIFPDVVFLNNWQHMHNFVSQIQHEQIDHSVYSRNRCFRMAGCCKYGDDTRVFTPGLPSSALIQVEAENCLKYVRTASLKERVSGKGVPVGMFNLDNLNVPDNWQTPLQGLEPSIQISATKRSSPLGVRTKGLEVGWIISWVGARSIDNEFALSGNGEVGTERKKDMASHF